MAGSGNAQNHERHGCSRGKAQCVSTSAGRIVPFTVAFPDAGVSSSERGGRSKDRERAALVDVQPVECLREEECVSPEALTPDRLDDECVMQAVQLGETNALGVLFERYYRLVFWVGLRILHNADEAQELVQEVFLYIHQRPAVFDARKGQFRSWLVQVAYSRAFNRAEYLKARDFVDYRDIQELLKSFKPLQVDQQQEAMCLRRNILDALRELTELQRATLEMLMFKGMTLREISKELNETLANTRHYYYRGLDKLRSSLK
jgi:RNA polymerase sigma-70 factor (ECF subfamily)